MSSPDDINQMIEDCEQRESRLDDWERGFVSDISQRLAEGQSLTGPQDDKLVEIWERIT